MASELPLFHFEPDPDQADVNGIKCDFVIEWHGLYYRCQIATGTYTSSGQAAPPFECLILYHQSVGDHRNFQGYYSYEEARDMKPAEGASDGK